jgi:hypothetical protein
MGEAKRRQQHEGRGQFRAPPRPCAYCANPADSKDHVPPKAMLRKPFPTLVTIPACTLCNARWGDGLDERFRNLLSFRIGTKFPNAKQFRDTRVTSGLKYRGPATRLVVARSEGWVEETPSGPIKHSDELLELDVRTYPVMLERLVRGLYYHLYREPLEPTTRIHSGVLADVGIARISPFFRVEEGHFIGPDFEFWATREDEDKAASLWFFRLYDVDCHLAATGQFAEVADRTPGFAVSLLVNDGEVIASSKRRV